MTVQNFQLQLGLVIQQRPQSKPKDQKYHTVQGGANQSSDRVTHPSASKECLNAASVLCAASVRIIRTPDMTTQTGKRIFVYLYYYCSKKTKSHTVIINAVQSSCSSDFN